MSRVVAGKSRVALFTSQDIGFQLVDGLLKRDNIELLVVTCRTARDDFYGYRSAIDRCAEAGIACIETTRADEKLVAHFAEFAPDVIVAAYYPHLIPLVIQKFSRRPPVNVHPGILPDYRGKFPTPWYILNGASEFGLALHQLDAGIDTGPVLVQRTYPIAPDETGHSLYRKTMDYAAKLILEQMDALIAGALPAIPQSGSGSYCSTIEPRFPINWDRSWLEIERRVRVHARPYFPAFTFVLNHMVSINRVSRVTPAGYRAQGGGRILEVHDDGSFIVSCRDGCLMVEDYELCPALPADQALRLLRTAKTCTA